MTKKQNKQYEEGKKMIAEYIEKMENLYEANKERFSEDMDFSELDYDDDIFAAITFNRTWNIINNDITAAEKNLYIVYLACEQDAYKTLEVFNGQGNGLKNIFVIRAMCFKIKEKIKKIYIEKYGRRYI